MPRHIAFLHTSPVHIETFGRLVKAVDPTIEAEHVVAEALLAEAQRLGADHPAVVSRVQDAMAEAAAHGAAVVVCTCSTIGAAAERTPRGRGFAAVRIDRAMANRAVALGPRIVVVAALESTCAPTQALIQESAARMGAAVQLTPWLVPGAWAHFLAGERDAYLQAIATAVRSAVQSATQPVAQPAARAATQQGVDVVVLAQASMAPAADLLNDLGVPVLSSPLLGVQSALAMLRGEA